LSQKLSLPAPSAPTLEAAVLVVPEPLITPISADVNPAFSSWETAWYAPSLSRKNAMIQFGLG
jgi:hypothetical protein